jgi:hypothetical protein
MVFVTRRPENDHIRSQHVAIIRYITYTKCVWFLHYCVQYNDVKNMKIITLALFYNVFYRVPEHSSCQAVSLQMQAFYAISYRSQEQNKRDTLYFM